MGLRFNKRITILPGIRLNLSKSGISLSGGVKGLRATIGSNGKLTTTASLPGTGLSYQKQFGLTKKNKAAEKKTGQTSRQAEESPALTSLPDNTEAAADPSVQPSARQQLAEYQQAIADAKQLHRHADQPVDWNEVASRPAPEKTAAVSLGDEIRGTGNDAAYSRWQTIHQLAVRVLQGDLDAYMTACSELKPFEDLLAYGSGFEVGTDNAQTLTVEFDVKAGEVLPDYQLGLNAAGQLTSTPMSQSSYNDLLQDYVCSACLRIGLDGMAALPVEYVIVHAVDRDAAGHVTTWVSVRFYRTTLAKMDMETIDPSAALTQFECHMSFTTTGGFAPVSQLG